MLIRQGGARDSGVDRRLACILAGVAGALNAAAFHAVGFFSANMTGNVSALSDHWAGGAWATGAFFLAIVVAFIGGSVASTLLVNAGRRRRVHAIYAYSILAEGVLLAMLGCADLLLPDAARAPALILGLSFLMGLQNAVVTRISDARVRTTHVSGMVTDIGIGLGMLIDIARGSEPGDEAAQIRTRLRLHGETVLSFLAGGVAGVLAYQVLGGLMLVATSLVPLAIALDGILRARDMAAPLDLRRPSAP